MIAAGWYGVDSDAVITHRVLKFAFAIDTLDEVDAKLILELIPRLHQQSVSRSAIEKENRPFDVALSLASRSNFQPSWEKAIELCRMWGFGRL